jgi:serine protease AprX
MKQSVVVFFIFFLFQAFTEDSLAQANLPRYWISFTDKENTPYSIDHPEAFLSQRSIERRAKQHIDITSEDLPVDPAYIDSLSHMGLHVLNISKWLNGVLAETDDTQLILTISHLGFVTGPVLMVRPPMNADKNFSDLSLRKNELIPTVAPYGYSTSQIFMLHGEYLHDQGFKGQGMLITILDAGFKNADKVSSLSHIWQDERIVAQKDFVKDTFNLFNSDAHGTLVFSIIAGIQEDILYGSAPEADFALVRTEEGLHENPVEEYNWACGAEFADSVGADVINSSLGYSLFDNPEQNHSYSDMNGRTTPISIAAGIAASKGMVVVSSAGNSGNTPWHYITAPADADSILTIGAVDSMGYITLFSSRGPSYDGRIKPDICAQGLNTVGQYPSGQFMYAAGTSCSAPIITGMAACLWQSCPGAGSNEIVRTFQLASDRFFNPDSSYGYGIPNLIKANNLLAGNALDSTAALLSINLFPDPTAAYLILVISRPKDSSEQPITISFYDAMGRMKNQELRTITGNNSVLLFENLSALTTGFYVMQLIISERTYSVPFMKI